MPFQVRVCRVGSRFQTVEKFQAPPNASYSLLPFRFLCLAADRYVITNMAGEYLIIRRAELDDLVKHRLCQGTVLYNDLLSRHFLSDCTSNLAHDLLAMKVRSKNRHLPGFTSLHIFVVTLRCEHSCPYCQVSRQSEDRSAFDMSAATADRALELVFRSPSSSIKI